MNKTLFLRAALCAMLLAPIVPITPVGFAQGAPGAAMAPSARVIVKYKADAALSGMGALSVRDQHALRAQSLGQRQRVALRIGKALHERAHVVFADGMSSSQLAAKLAQDSDVELAVPDGRKRRAVAPNDSRYLTVGGTGPASGQWYLRPNAGEVKSSIDVEPAWTITTGSNTVVVAVVDTGVRFDHPDLKKVANGGNLLDGYDVVSDLDTANDLTGIDPDASDPGDWLDQADINSGKYSPTCTAADISDSSWHGTETAGLIGALTNNVEGMASVGRTVRVLPVRVLGKCGGFDSDIIAGMRWAAGLLVPGVPANPNPAKVINMSLGGADPCNGLYPDTVNQIIAAGVTIVASSGNSDGHAVNSPANCPGVIAVAGLRHVGSKVGFSDIGPEVSISAPGGNCVNTGSNEPCLYPILTTSNTGVTTPAGASYSDSFKVSVGTSFSAPLVAGTAALMLSARPGMTPAEIRSFLRATAREFPTTGAESTASPTIPQCVAPSSQAQDQCYCTTTTCGAGMLDAGAAVQHVALGVAAIITVDSPSPTAGQPVTLRGTESLAITGRTIDTFLWAIVNNGGIVTTPASTNGSTASVTPSAAGQFSVSLTVTDNTGAQTTSTRNIVVASRPSAATSSSGGALSAVWLALLLGAVLALARRRA